MSNMLEYKGYYGDAVYSPEDHVFYGKLQDISAYVDYSGDSVAELESSFHEAVEDYLVFCEDEGIEAEKPYENQLLIRLSEPAKAKVIDISMRRHISIDQTIEQALEAYEG